MTIAASVAILHASQRRVARALLRRTMREVYVCAGRRWGKGILCLLLCLEDAARGGHALWIAPTARQSAIAWRRAKKMLAKLIASGVVQVRESDVMLSIGAGTITFRSAEAGDAIRGDAHTLIVADEAAYLDESFVESVLLPMLLDFPDARIVYISTPRRKGDHFHVGWKRAAANDNGTAAAFHFTSFDNPHLPRASLEALRAKMAPVAFAREILADMEVSAEAILFPTIIQGPPPQSFRSTSLGCDPAFSEKTSADYSALVVNGIDDGGQEWTLHAIRGHWPLSDLLANIEDVAVAWHVSSVAIEDVAAQKGLIQLAQRSDRLRNIPVHGVRPVGDKYSRAAIMEPRIRSGAHRFSDQLPQWFVDDVTGYPLIVHDDAIDALGLAHVAALTAGPTHGVGIVAVGSQDRAAGWASALPQGFDSIDEYGRQQSAEALRWHRAAGMGGSIPNRPETIEGARLALQERSRIHPAFRGGGF